jgi:hypothetical protein
LSKSRTQGKGILKNKLTKTCPFKKSENCPWCLRKGHGEDDCPVRQLNLTKEDIVQEVTCFVCGKNGHLNCGYPKKRVKKYYCFKCGQDHSGLHCKRNKK